VYGEWAQNVWVERREYCRNDADRQPQDRGCRECPALPQSAERVAEVEPERFDEAEPLAFVEAFACACDVAESPQSEETTSGECPSAIRR
jgi:hypothetical protein